MSSDLQILENKPSKELEQPSFFLVFQTQFDAEQEPERRVRLAIDFMRTALAQPQSPHFKDFWEARRLCLPLFKENLNAKSRTLLWAEYIEISAEARHLKEILDEQSAFAVEQIELAIDALEKEMANYDVLLQQFPPIAFPEACQVLQKKCPFYNNVQRELNFLNTFASRINSMRKEIIKTEMRIRHKNKFFEKLSLVGDRIFPKRKDLIKQVSDEFVNDVTRFIHVHFVEEEHDDTPLFVLREDIKTLQSFAKILTLNTQAFSDTRLQLSECWDKLKEREKDRKKEMTAKKLVFKQNYDLVIEKIRVLAEKCLGEALPEEEKKLVDEILEFMRSVELGREEVKALHEEIFKAREPLLHKQKEEERKRQEEVKEVERIKKAKSDALKAKILGAVQEAEDVAYEQLIVLREDLLKDCEQLGLSKGEKPQFDKLFKQLKEKIEEKREKTLLNLSEADQQAFQQLKSFLEEKKQERLEIKSTLENCRKVIGGSGFDFEKAMHMREVMENEKARLDKVNASIEELEEKIAAFEAE